MRFDIIPPADGPRLAAFPREFSSQKLFNSNFFAIKQCPTKNRLLARESVRVCILSFYAFPAFLPLLYNLIIIPFDFLFFLSLRNLQHIHARLSTANPLILQSSNIKIFHSDLVRVTCRWAPILPHLSHICRLFFPLPLSAPELQFS